MKEILALFGVVALIPVSAIWYGYVLSIVWGWFITPTLGPPRLSIPAAIGVAAAVRFITHQDIKDKDDEETSSKRWAGIFVRAFGYPAFTLVFCWVVKFWM